jgi:ribonuclease-3
MEFLGDSVLSLVVNEYLYDRFPEWQEGQLTQIKSLVVSKRFLAKKAEEIHLGQYLLLSENESMTGGRERESITADAFEAVIGAMYIDRGLKVTRIFLKNLICSEIEDLYEAEKHLNSKSLLQEHLQQEMKCQPRYKIRKVQGPDHRRLYTIDVYVRGRRIGSGKGYSKKSAQLNAAREALKKLHVNE